MTWSVSAADALRMVGVLLALVLVALVGAAVVYATTWDQRARFLTLGGYGVVTVGGVIDTLGQPVTWPVLAIVPVTAVAVIGAAVFLTKVRRGPRLAGDQLAVPGARAHPRGGRHAASGALSERGGDAS